MKRFPFPVDADVPLYLAPMAGVSESPFRRLCRRFGADVVVTEFLSAEGIRRENEATISKLRFGAGRAPDRRADLRRRPGGDGRSGARSSPTSSQPEFIDINFGCPVKKVVKRNGGSGCLKDLDLVQQVIRAVVARHASAGDVQDPQRLERGDARSGDDRAALPGRRRSRARAASAHAHADVLGQRALGGDRRRGRRRSTFRCSATATSRRRRTRCACSARPAAPAIMIARGSFGQPWIFDQTRDLLEGRPMRPAPSVEERFAIALEHARMADDVRARPPRRRHRVPQAPRLVREGTARLGRAAQEAARGRRRSARSKGSSRTISRARERYAADADDAPTSRPLETAEV